jgi:hypothetical protein
MFAQMTEKIELKFWDICIPLLSKAEWIRPVLQQMKSITQNEVTLKRIAMITVIGCAGAASGMLLFSISILIS